MKNLLFDAMVKVLTILKSPCVKECYLIQKFEPVIERVYLA